MTLQVYPTPLTDYFTEIAIGNVSGQKIIRAYGERASIQTTATGEDLWRGNELAVAPTSTVLIPTPDSAGEQMSVKSEHATDESTGVGAQIVTIEYLDASGDEQTTTVIMDGITGVDLTPSNVRFVNDMYVSQVGTNGVAVGNIFIYKKATPGLVYQMISAGGNKSLVPNRMVPNGKNLILQSWSASESTNKETTIVRIRADCTPAGVLQDGAFLFKGTCFVNMTNSAEMSVYATIPALSTVKASAWSTTTANAAAAMNWWGILIDD
jgi:hypothetical protein